MTIEERWRFVDEMREIREHLRQRITDLSRERKQTVSNRIATAAVRGPQLFDEVVRRTIREQAEEKGFFFPAE